MTELTDIVMPSLSNQPNVEIAQTGQWDISTGRVVLTHDDFANAVAALDCPAVRKPVLKIGHTDPRFDGEPTVGWIDNMSVTDGGHTIVGDYVGMPGWLGPILPSAYPDRSMEATWDFMCQLGHVHPFVITAVALLGVTPPGIGTLESLQDVASLYGVDMMASKGGRGFSVSIHAKGVSTMPNPRPREVAAGVSAEDLRRGFYESPTVPPTTWIKEIELEPLQLITVDEATGQYSRVPVTINGDGFEFGDAVPVNIVYEDAPQEEKVAASRIVYASRDESRLSKPPVNTPDPVTPKEGIKRVHAASNAQQKEGESGDMDPAKIREAVGLPADASDEDVFAALNTLRQGTGNSPDPTPTETVTPVAAGSGVMVVDRSVVEDLKNQARKGEEAFKMLQRSNRDRVIGDAIACGKFAPTRKEHWERLWDADPEGTEAQIKNLASGLVPLQAAGYPGTETAEQDEQYFRLFPEEKMGA